MKTIRNARIEGGIVLHQEDGPYLITGCLFTPVKATRRQLARWYWFRLVRWVKP